MSSRTDTATYSQTPAYNYSDADEKADDKKREIREDEFWSIFVHGDNLNGDMFESIKIAEDIMHGNDKLYAAAIKVVAQAIAVSTPKSPLEKIADSAARDFMNSAIDTNTDDWSGD